jgi:excinuclease UvrABC nuclease subunit
MSKYLIPNYPDCAGYYIVRDTKGKIKYIGSSDNVRRRVSFLASTDRFHLKAKKVKDHQHTNGDLTVEIFICKNKNEAMQKEKRLIESLPKTGNHWNKKNITK